MVSVGTKTTSSSWNRAATSPSGHRVAVVDRVERATHHTQPIPLAHCESGQPRVERIVGLLLGVCNWLGVHPRTCPAPVTTYLVEVISSPSGHARDLLVEMPIFGTEAELATIDEPAGRIHQHRGGVDLGDAAARPRRC